MVHGTHLSSTCLVVAAWYRFLALAWVLSNQEIKEKNAGVGSFIVVFGARVDQYVDRTSWYCAGAGVACSSLDSFTLVSVVLAFVLMSVVPPRHAAVHASVHRAGIRSAAVRAGVCHAAIRIGIRRAAVRAAIYRATIHTSVCRADIRYTSIPAVVCHASICASDCRVLGTGIRPAGICAGIHRAGVHVTAACLSRGARSCHH